ncbi:hypothetical protein N7497_011738 [Penicillium chrysogenum]|nr:hypothetical protein N7497_011738 [Penicillium chrysogenum]
MLFLSSSTRRPTRLIAESSIPFSCRTAVVPLIALPGFLLVQKARVAGIGRPEEAHVFLVQYHAAGDYSAIRAEKDANNNGSWAEMVKTPGNRRRLMISISLGIFAQWAGNGVISYYLSLILTSVGVTNVRDYTLISACLQMWDPAFATLAP